MTNWRCHAANAAMLLFGLAILGHLAAGQWSTAALTAGLLWWFRRYARGRVLV